MDTKELERTGCPMEKVVEVIGGKWKTVILFHLLANETLRFGELKKIAVGITQKMLTTQLRALEADGLIVRKVYPVVPPKVEYSLSEKGKTLGPILIAMKNWGSANIETPVSAESTLTR